MTNPYDDHYDTYSSSYENDEDNPSPTMSGKGFMDEILSMVGPSAPDREGLGELFKRMTHQSDYKWTHKVELSVTVVDVHGRAFNLNPWEMTCPSDEEDFDKANHMAEMGQRASDLLREHSSMGGSVGENYVTFMADSIARIVFSCKYLGKSPNDAKKEADHGHFH